MILGASGRVAARLGESLKPAEGIAGTYVASLCRPTFLAVLTRRPSIAIISASQYHYPMREKLAHLGQVPTLGPVS